MLDGDFEVPIPGAKVTVVETGEKTSTDLEGAFVFEELEAGTYTLVASKSGYVRSVRGQVLVSPGSLTEIDFVLHGDYTEMDEFLVPEELQGTMGREAELMELRLESPALMNAISADLMGRAGASDAAAALKLVSGATVQDGKYAVVRGLPNRYISSQLNGVRLPSTDDDKRAIELDQYPTVILDSIRVTKTFTPDQPGDATGGAVDVRLKGIPSGPLLEAKAEVSFNSQAAFRKDFLSYRGGGVSFLGKDDGGRDIQGQSLGQSWSGAVGTQGQDAPQDYKVSLSAGDRWAMNDEADVGWSATAFYERDSSFYENGVNDSYWVENPGQPLTPQTFQGAASGGDFKTGLFDVAQGGQLVQLGTLLTLGMESERNDVSATLSFSRTAEDKATLAEDTRGKEYFFPGYDPNDPSDPGNDPDAGVDAAPYLRLQTLEYTERSNGSLQFRGRHRLGSAAGDKAPSGLLELGGAEVTWLLAHSFASLNQPDKRQFGALWKPQINDPGFPPFIPPFSTPPTYFPFKPAENFNLGNLQRIWKTIDESSTQAAVDLKADFTQWDGLEGYAKTGLFADRLDRKFNQDTFSNFGDTSANFQGNWNQLWTDTFPFEDHPITAADTDVDYTGGIDVSAAYGMLDLPVTSALKVVGGVRVESTGIDIVNDPEKDAVWFPPGATAPVALPPSNGGGGPADVAFRQTDLLPSLSFQYDVNDEATLRASYSRTLARQTFKELTPVVQQEFLGGPIFIGNPGLGTSEITNWDLRAEYNTDSGGQWALSWFTKDIKDPIEYVQRLATFSFTTATNYPTGSLTGWELEGRQDLGAFRDSLDGLTLGANATILDSSVRLPEEDVQGLAALGLNMPSRDMVNTPDHLINLFANWAPTDSTSEVSVFYTLTGESLVAGAGESGGNLIPNVYQVSTETLNVAYSKSIGRMKINLAAKNITNPKVGTVFRFEGEDTTRTSHTNGVEFVFSVTLNL